MRHGTSPIAVHLSHSQWIRHSAVLIHFIGIHLYDTYIVWRSNDIIFCSLYWANIIYSWLTICHIIMVKWKHDRKLCCFIFHNYRIFSSRLLRTPTTIAIAMSSKTIGKDKQIFTIHFINFNKHFACYLIWRNEYTYPHIQMGNKLLCENSNKHTIVYNVVQFFIIRQHGRIWLLKWIFAIETVHCPSNNDACMSCYECINFYGFSLI